mgnify:CR=1 FL=1
MYHDITKEEKPCADMVVTLQSFSAQMQWLSLKKFQTLTVVQLINQLTQSKKLSGKLCLITFDDAYSTVLHYAKPIMDQYGFVATVFPVVAAIGKHNIWDPHLPKRPCMNRHELKLLQRNNWEIGSHGLTHINLARSQPERIRKEVQESKQQLEQTLGEAVQTFCYPYGACSSQAHTIVKSAGYTSACAIKPQTSSVTDDVLALRRVYVRGSDSLLSFRRKISLWHLKYRALRKR